MAISFVVADGIEAAKFEENAVEYSEEIQDFLTKNKQMFEGNIDILVELDPYGDTCIADSDILIMKEAAQLIQGKLESLSDLSEVLEELIDFTKSITDYCIEAIQKELCLIAIGD